MIRWSMVAVTSFLLPESRVLIAHLPSEVKCKSGVNTEGCLLHLKHPKTGSKASYFLIEEAIQEIHWFKEPFSSWFIGNHAVEDGSLYISMPIDPIFLLLPILDEARMKKIDDQGKFRSLEEILYMEGYPGYTSLVNILPNVLDLVCEVKDVGATKFYRLDDAKVLSWLRCKVKLAVQGLDVLDGYSCLPKEAKEAHAIGLIGDYLKESPWLEILCKHFGVDLQAYKKPALAESEEVFDPKPNFGKNDGNATTGNGKSKKKRDATGLRKVTQFFARER